MPLLVFCLWLIVLNGSTIGLATVMFCALADSRERRNFLLFLISYFLWANGVILVQLFGVSSPYSRVVSQTIFATGALLAIALGHFLLTFANSPMKHSLVYRILQLNAFILSPLSFTGLIEAGIAKSEAYGLAPLPGPLLSYYNLSLLFLSGSYFYATFQAYRQSKDRLLRYQLGIIFGSACVSLNAAITTNVIIPGVSGNYALSPMGGLWILILFCGIAHIIVTGRHLLLYDSFQTLLQEPTNDSPWGVEQFEGLINAVLRGDQQYSISKEYIADGPNKVLMLEMGGSKKS